jgi:uncharacterized protein (TIGR02001 family)
MIRKHLFIALILTGCWGVGYATDAHAAPESDDDSDTSAAASPAAGTTSAEEKASPWGNTTANVAFTSDYIFRGQSQTEHQPAIQGGLDWTHPTGIYLGAWGSNVRYSDVPATVELDVYGGYTYNFDSKTNLSLGLFYYSYFSGAQINTWEIPLALVWKTFKLGVNYAPHWSGTDAAAWYFTAGWADKIIWSTQLGLTAGYSVFGPTVGYNNYADFRVSVSRELVGVTWDISGVFVNQQQRQFNGADDPRVVFTASKSF